MVLPHTPCQPPRFSRSDALADPDPHAARRHADPRRHACVPEIAQALYRESAKPENFGDKWLGRAFYIAAHRHQQDFLAAHKADKAAVPFSALPVPLRIGNLKPDWRCPPRRTPPTGRTCSCQAPGKRADYRLRRRRVVHANVRIEGDRRDDAVDRSRAEQRRGLGERLVAGVRPRRRVRGPGGGRGGGGRFAIPDGTLRPGANTIAVRIQNGRGRGFTDAGSDVRRRARARQPPLCQAPGHRVERQTNAGAMSASPASSPRTLRSRPRAVSRRPARSPISRRRRTSSSASRL